MHIHSLKYFLIACFTFFFLSTILFANPAESDSWVYTQTSQSALNMTPKLALQKLEDGNKRFVKGTMRNRNLINQAKLTKKAQYPFAVILSCMDSRGSPELIFDQGIGDVFSVRVAGNVVDPDQLGSMEYATKAVGSRVIVVLGHTSCGAIRGACEGAQLGNLTQLLDKITPAVATVNKELEQTKPNCNDAAIVNKIAEQNVRDIIQTIKKNSPIINRLEA